MDCVRGLPLVWSGRLEHKEFFIKVFQWLFREFSNSRILQQRLPPPPPAVPLQPLQPPQPGPQARPFPPSSPREGGRWHPWLQGHMRDSATTAAETRGTQMPETTTCTAVHTTPTALEILCPCRQPGLGHAPNPSCRSRGGCTHMPTTPEAPTSAAAATAALPPCRTD